jgi:hypothetical protein
MPEHLELPRPLRLLRTAAWSLTEAAGLPVAAYAVAAWLGGRNAGLLAALAAIWATAAIRKVATGRIPSLLTISAVVLTLQTAAVIGTGELWIFLLQFPVANLCMCVLFARTARGPNPLVARLAAEVVALRLPATHHLGLHRFFQRATWLWAGIFLALTGLLAVLMATEPGGLFLMLSTVVTTALIVAGAGASTLWFLFALRGLGLALRFAAPLGPARPAGMRQRRMLARLPRSRNALTGQSHHRHQRECSSGEAVPDSPGVGGVRRLPALAEHVSIRLNRSVSSGTSALVTPARMV